eukprot:TRINITY_DN2344_c0_g2_i6.p1 TRINITY_DN2344_c0_g2~~TRINITY_DN2344_c0_g2_i6.p1  ORF type:complete len:331 (+),score=41.98 TRINITY_DN2344_c0_g2_i6:89-994(+)
MCRSRPKTILMNCRRMVCSKADPVQVQSDPMEPVQKLNESARRLNEAIGKLFVLTEKKSETTPKTRNYKRRRYNGTKAVALSLIRQQKEIEKLDAKLDSLRRMVEDLSEQKDPSRKKLHSVIGLILLALGTASGCAVIDDRFKYYSNCVEEVNQTTTLDAIAKAITTSTHIPQFPQKVDSSQFFNRVTLPERYPHRAHVPFSASHFGLYSWSSPAAPPVTPSDATTPPDTPPMHHLSTPTPAPTPLADTTALHKVDPCLGTPSTAHSAHPRSPLGPMSPSPSYNSTGTGNSSGEDDFVLVD